MSSNTISNNNTLAVILARGGSKRIPGKNKRLLNGKPLIAYTFESATSSDCFDKIVLSTDDESIAGIAEEYNIEVDSRPEELAGDETRAVEVIYEFLTRTKAEQSYRYIAMLLPTCPFRTSEDIQNAVNHYKVIADDARPLVSVVAYDFPPQLALRSTNGGLGQMVDADAYVNSTRSQSIEPLYHPNGAIYLASIDTYLKEKTFFQEEMAIYVMPPERSLDIDYEYQFLLAEQLMNTKLT